jgi:uncharacterized protein YoxC
MSLKNQKKRGNSNNPFDKEEVICQLIDRFNLYIIVSIIIGIVCAGIPLIIQKMNIPKISENPLFLVLSPLLLLLLTLVISPGSTKEFITAKVNKFDKELSKNVDGLSREKEELNGQINKLNQQINKLNQQINKLNQQIEDLKKNKDANIIKEQRLRYLADIYMVNENTLNQKKIISLVLQEYSDKFPNGYEQVEAGLTKSSTDYQSRRNLRAVITTINKRSWNRLATAAASKVFDLKQDDKDRLGYEPEKSLFVDIYIYLCAWLVNSIEVNSIDNNIPTYMRYMPVKEIGLNYHDSNRKIVDIEAYNTALSELIKFFDLGTFAILFDDIQVLSPEQIDICKEGVSPYLTVLIKMLNDFFEKLTSEEISRTSGENR